MTKKIFKGIRQVDSVKFNSTPDKVGYLWFVRTEVKTEGEETNNVENDEFDIYFGTKHYGHFQEGELEAIKNAIEALNGQIEDILGLLEDLQGLAESNKAAHEANAQLISGLQGQLKDYLVKNVDANDKVLNVADGILASQISLAYEGGHIKLFGKSKEVTTTNEAGEEVTTIEKEILGSIDASDFIKDSVLDDVEVVTRENEKYIVFTWKTEGDAVAKTDEIKVSDFAKLYKAGNALELAADGVTFNVKVAANENFLSVNGNNELIVDDMTVDKTLIKEAITIEGGPLATEGIKNAFEGGIIPAGTSIQAVLKALLCVEIYPTPAPNEYEYTAEITAPTITAYVLTGDGSKKTISTGALVEVGQKVYFNSVTAKAVTITPTNPTVSGFTHGYSDSLTGTINTSESITTEWEIKPMSNHVYELSAISEKFKGTVPETKQNAVAASCELSACVLTAVEGDNIYSVTEDAPKHTGKHAKIDSYYIVSNLGGRSEAQKSEEIKAEENIEVDPENQTGKFKVTGVYPLYTNGVASSVDKENKPVGERLTAPVSEGTQLSLKKKGSTFVVAFAAQGLEPFRLFLPKGWSITSAYYSDPLANGALQANGTTYFKANGTKSFTVQNTLVEYNVYEWAGGKGADFVKFTVA
jgi:hypothetical protein